MNIIGMMLVRNEMGRWLKRVLHQMFEICDRVIIIDDCSDDGTYEYLCDLEKDFDIEIFKSKEQSWNKNELAIRAILWGIVEKQAKQGDWILCLDADELFVDEHIPYIRYVFKTCTSGIDAIGFRLHDMWNDTHYRDDQYWTAHLRYWPMAVRYNKNTQYEWINRPLHCGRFPANAAKAMLPTMIPIKHMGWSREADRIKKYERYMAIDADGKNGSLEQYKSILDKNPNLKVFGG